MATTRNSVLAFHTGYPVLAYESAWPVRSGTKTVGAIVVLSQISDETLNSSLAPAKLQAAVIAPQQRLLLAATTEVRRLNNQRQLPATFFGDTGAKQPIFVQDVTDGQPYYFAGESLPSQPIASQLLLGVSAQDVTLAAEALHRQTVIVGVVAVAVLAALEAGLLFFVLRPLRRLTKRARAISLDAGIQVIPPAAGPRDLTVVRETLSQMSESLAEAKREQRSDRTRVEGIIDSMAEGVVVSDVQRHVTYVNPVAKRLLGIHGAEEATALPGDLVAVYQGGKNPVEVTANSKVLRSRSAPIIGDTGQTTGYVTVLRDASQEAELDRLKSDFVGVVSHELRTPLTSIKGSVDLLLDEESGEFSATQRRFLSTIRRSSDRLINLVNDLLDLSRLEVGSVQLDCHPVDVRHLVNDTVNSLGNLFAAKKQSVRTSSEPELPPVLADRQRLEQVLVNLLGNASKYTPDDGEIAVYAHVDGQRVVVEVSDTGPGLSADEIERIFEKFYRVGDSLTRQQTGSGLGLAIARSLVDLHGGELWVTSEPGHGATFYVGLPIYDDEE